MRSPLSMVALAVALSSLPARAGEAAGVATIVEGRAWLIRGAALYPLKEGLALSTADILETEARAQVQVEFQDGSTLSLGPSTSAYLLARPQGAGKPGDLVLHAGWIKVSGPGGAGLLRVLTPDLAIHPKAGAFVLRREGAATECFVESGEVTPAIGGKTGRLLEPRRAGDFLELRADRTLNVLNRPNPSFRSAIPRPFLDTLPSRLGKIKGRSVEPQRERLLSPDEAERWLRAFPSERAALLRRFSGHLKDHASKGSP